MLAVMPGAPWRQASTLSCGVPRVVTAICAGSNYPRAPACRQKDYARIGLVLQTIGLGVVIMIAACVFILRAIGGFSHVLRDCRSVAQGISFSNAGIEVQLATQEANMSIFLAAVRFAELPLAVSKPLAGACLLLAVLSTSAGAADAPRSREA